MTEAKIGLALMREPFPKHLISKLPKPTKAQTEEVKSDFKKGHRCEECGAWHAKGVVHLDYVGHAALTDRLLDADAAWAWEPLAMADSGLPVMDSMGGMWIKLTVCGVTRIGYGHAVEKSSSGAESGGNAIKEVIGDALRNAAMRFGAALDLWHKGQLHADEDQPKPRHPSGPIKPTEGARSFVSEERAKFLEWVAQHLIECYKNDDSDGAMTAWNNPKNFEHNEERIVVWDMLSSYSKLRAYIKKHETPLTYGVTA